MRQVRNFLRLAVARAPFAHQHRAIQALLCAQVLFINHIDPVVTGSLIGIRVHCQVITVRRKGKLRLCLAIPINQAWRGAGNAKVGIIAIFHQHDAARRDFTHRSGCLLEKGRIHLRIKLPDQLRAAHNNLFKNRLILCHFQQLRQLRRVS